MTIWYVSPDEEELRSKYNPELKKKSLEGRDEKLQAHQEFVEKMREFSKSDKPIWTVWKEHDRQERLKTQAAQRDAANQKRSIAEEMRRQRLGKSQDEKERDK
ncbi:MAG: assembly factor cbp4 [Alyxoria varia]|nr:MAG: assembly factor cbp4 [Alyxoria varia]